MTAYRSEKPAGVLRSATLCKTLDLPVAHREHHECSQDVWLGILAFLALGARRSAVVAAERLDKHFFAGILGIAGNDGAFRRHP